MESLNYVLRDAFFCVSALNDSVSLETMYLLDPASIAR